MTDHEKQPSDDTSVTDLLLAERELTSEEQETLATVGRSAWHEVMDRLRSEVHQTYSVCPPEDFRRCVGQHMTEQQQAEMIKADTYVCPKCSTPLKNRRNVAASAVLLERDRIRQLWEQVENAEGEDQDQAFERFRAALGL